MAKKSNVRAATTVDVRIGEKIRSLRLLAGMSQTELGEKLGVSFQQIQKYEKGVNRVGSGKLTMLASALGASVADLIEEGDVKMTKATADVVDMMKTSEGVRLAKAFTAIKKGEKRTQIVRLIEMLSELA